MFSLKNLARKGLRKTSCENLCQACCGYISLEYELILTWCCIHRDFKIQNRLLSHNKYIYKAKQENEKRHIIHNSTKVYQAMQA